MSCSPERGPGIPACHLQSHWEKKQNHPRPSEPSSVLQRFWFHFPVLWTHKDLEAGLLIYKDCRSMQWGQYPHSTDPFPNPFPMRIYLTGSDPWGHWQTGLGLFPTQWTQFLWKHLLLIFCFQVAFQSWWLAIVIYRGSLQREVVSFFSTRPNWFDNFLCKFPVINISPLVVLL